MTVTVVSHKADVLRKLTDAKKRALNICGGKAETYAIMNCPVVTGWLSQHITHRLEDENTEAVGTNVEYAPYVELGHHQQPGRFVPAENKLTGKFGFRLVHDYVPGHPYLRPALEDHISEYKSIIETELGKI